MTDAAKKTAGLLASARQGVVLTGAGISTPSGIPDFRSSKTGLWEKDNPMLVASLTSFQRTPEKFYNWLRPLAESMVQADPNPAHFALAALQQAGHLQAIVTQNIDGLHQRAGAQNVIELHGSMAALTCPACKMEYPESQYRSVFFEEKKMPQCNHCRAILKPNIVLFEEMLPVKAWSDAEAHFERADLVIVIGSSLEVSPAGSLPLLSLERGAKLIINNYTNTYLDHEADILLPVDVAEIWPAVVELLR